MTECFKGWRRKAGVFTLAMACLFLGLWVRSFSPEWQSIKYRRHLFQSSHGSLYWNIFYDGDWADSVPQESMQPGWKIKWKREWFGLMLMDQAIYTQYGLQFGISHWHLILPLSLLSAYLLLVKPRVAKSMKTTTGEGT